MNPDIPKDRKCCYNCEHLEWVEAEMWDPAGFCCNNRDYRNEYEEDKHLAQLERESYLLKGKSCFEKRII